METTKNKKIIIGIIIVIALALGAWLIWERTPSYSFPLTAGDSVESWSYQSAYTGNAELEAKAQTEITRLQGLFGEEGYSDYELYVSIANQYGLLGDGKSEYNNLRKALAIDAESTGLAWHNMGKLMERIGAIETGRIAFERAVGAQPQLIYYHTVLVEYLMAHMPEDTAAIAGQKAEIEAITGEAFIE